MRHLCSPILGTAIFCVALAIVSHSPAAAQSHLIDGYSVGGGIAIFQGDVDGNPDSDPGVYIASSNLHLFAGIDRINGITGMSVRLAFDRSKVDNFAINGSNNYVSLDAAFSARLDAIRLASLEIDLGLAPTLVVPSYSRLEPFAVVGEWADPNTRLTLTVPMGVTIQDRVRFGLRLPLSDGMDGSPRGKGGDWLWNVAVMYRGRFN